jgi:dCMP deaminase
VGCILLNNRGHVIATGYNGVASGMEHCNKIDMDVISENDNIFAVEQYPNICPGALSKSGTNLDSCYAIHAEQNAMLQCKNIYEIETCYVTASPCITCVKLLMNTSCKEIVFNEEYPNSEDSAKLWQDIGRVWRKYDGL